MVDLIVVCGFLLIVGCGWGTVLNIAAGNVYAAAWSGIATVAAVAMLLMWWALARTVRNRAEG